MSKPTYLIGMIDDMRPDVDALEDKANMYLSRICMKHRWPRCPWSLL